MSSGRSGGGGDNKRCCEVSVGAGRDTARREADETEDEVGLARGKSKESAMGVWRQNDRRLGGEKS